MSKLKGLIGQPRQNTEQKRTDRQVRRFIKEFPQFWPASVVHGKASYRDMPADQFDWAIAQIEKIAKERKARRDERTR
jgi:hypothetical protein